VSRYQKGKINLDFTEARDGEWQWHQLSHVQVCTSLQTDNHASTPLLSFLQAGCPSCRPTNSVKALKASASNNRTKTNWVGLLATTFCSTYQHSEAGDGIVLLPDREDIRETQRLQTAVDNERRRRRLAVHRCSP